MPRNLGGVNESRLKATASRPATRPSCPSSRPAARCAGHGAARPGGQWRGRGRCHQGARRGRGKAVEHALAQRGRQARAGVLDLDAALALGVWTRRSSISPPGGLWRMALSWASCRRAAQVPATPLSEIGTGAWSTKAMSSWRSSARSRASATQSRSRARRSRLSRAPRCPTSLARQGQQLVDEVACAGHALLHAAVGLRVGHGRRGGGIAGAQVLELQLQGGERGAQFVGRRPARSGVAPPGPGAAGRAWPRRRAPAGRVRPAPGARRQQPWRAGRPACRAGPSP